jgi:thiamine-phosphate pyrophosphorylase
VRPDLQFPLIYLITDGAAKDRTFESDSARIAALAKLAIDLRVSLFQLRESALSGKNLFTLSSEVAALTRGTGTRFLVNDRADIAKASGADGVHLKSSSLPSEVVRECFGRDFLIGLSTHTPAEISTAKKAADFVVFGPVFSTPGKSEAKGLDGLRSAREVDDEFPILGLGGIDSTNCKDVIAAGASGIAGIRSLNDPASLAKIVKVIHGT